MSKEAHKRHSNDHRSQMSGIVQSEEGLVSVNEKNEWLRKRREINTNPSAGHSDLISGTGASESERWKTNNQRMDSREPTSRDQMTRDKRERAVPKRSIADGREGERTGSSRSIISDGSGHPALIAMNSMREQSIGSGGMSGRNGSMLSNIGQAIVRRLPSEDSVRLEKGHEPAPRPRPY